MDISPLSTNDTVGDALQKMEELGFVHWPIVENGEYDGMISENIALEQDEATVLETLKHQLLHSAIVGDRHIADAIRMYGEESLSILPVVDDANHYEGYLLPQDILRKLGSQFSWQAPGSVLILEVNQFDFSMAQIAQIVESNDAKILASYVDIDTNKGVYRVTVRINFTDLSSIIATFKRYDYVILDSWHENRYERDLKDRYDQFMNYLNM